MGKLVSINCITYNHERYIADAIEGFLKQKTDFDYEIIIGDDCSTDKTREIIERYITKYPNKIKLITSQNNVGAHENEKRVFKASTGKYIAICEGDDYWIDENKLQKQIEYMEKNPKCAMSFHNAKLLNDETNTIEGLVSRGENNTKYQTQDIITGGGAFVATASIVYRREIMNDAPKWYYESVVGDYPLQMIASTFGYVYYFKDIMSVYRINVRGSWTYENGIVGKTVEKDKKFKIGMIKMLDNFDSYTNSKYHEEIERAKLPFKFGLDLINGDLKSIKDSPYEDYFKSFRAKNKLKVYLMMYSPSLTIKIIEINNLLKYKYKNLVRRRNERK